MAGLDGWPTVIDTWPGGHSAKNAHRAGAPYPQQTSGETTMVGNKYSPDTGDVNFLVASMSRTGKSLAASAVVQALAAELVQVRAERAALWLLLKEQTRAVRTLRTDVAESETACWALDGEITDLQIELNQVHAQFDTKRAKKGHQR